MEKTMRRFRQQLPDSEARRAIYSRSVIAEDDIAIVADKEAIELTRKRK